MEKQACNFKKYNSKGQRMSLFIRALDNFTAEIVEFTCSKDDNFNKKFAREQYEFYSKNGYTIDSTAIITKINLEAHSLKFTLNKYANENYYNLVIQVIKWEKADDKHITKLEFNPHKKTLIAKTLTK